MGGISIDEHFKNSNFQKDTSNKYGFLIHSDDTMMSHTKGVKHIKKKIAMEEKNAALRSQGIAAETKVVRQVSKI